MADSKNDIVLEWLGDAHAKAQQSKYLYDKQADQMVNYPELRPRFNEQAEKSRRHLTLIQNTMERLGGSPSTIKDIGGKVMAWGQSVAGMPLSDEVVKGVMFCYSFQQMGIASYRILIAAAEEAGDHETARVCGEIMRDDEDMAQWLYDRLPEITQTYMRRKFNGDETAKR